MKSQPTLSIRTRFNYARYAFVLSGAALSLCPACRTSTLGLPIALVGDSITESQALGKQGRLLGRPWKEAEGELGPATDKFVDLSTGEKYIAFNSFRMFGKQSFSLVQISRLDRVLDVQDWIEWHDGFEDSYKLSRIKPKVIGEDPATAERAAKLKPPIFVFAPEGQDKRLRVYDATNWTHIRKRMLMLEFDGNGICQAAKYYGVAGCQQLRSRLAPSNTAWLPQPRRNDNHAAAGSHG
ncbi:MAG: hypothetical protein HY287_08360 [Planctomycetes bacterium]|nr:hypothetical protein [Planctomycetota bacterium]MBI3834326.1 hypothetical protein [Planctomycetota bacterium]